MIRLSKSVVGEEEAKAIHKIITEDGYLGMGKEVEKFEEDLALFLEREKKEVTCVSSGTAALHLAVESIITEKKKEIIVPSLTYVSSYQAIVAGGGIPVSCDVDINTWNLDLSKTQRLISKRTAAIMTVHYASNPTGIIECLNLARRKGIRVIEDAAHAFGSTIDNKKIGSFGDIICFSFDGIKNITSGEGGAIISKDTNVIKYVKDARLLGVMNDTEKRFNSERSWDFDVVHQGYRFHMSNIFAAIGRIQLIRFKNEFSKKRTQLLLRYRSNLNDCKDIIFQKINKNVEIIPHILPVLIPRKRDEIRKKLIDSNIQVGIHYKPNHLLSYFKDTNKEELENCLKIYENTLTLPLHPDLSLEDVDKICEIIINELKQ